MLRASYHRRGVCLSVRSSVCPSHFEIVQKPCKLGSRNLHSALQQELYSFLRQNFVPLRAGVSVKRERRRGVPLEKRYFATIGSSTDMLFIATSTSHGLLSFVNIDDFERP